MGKVFVGKTKKDVELLKRQKHLMIMEKVMVIQKKI
jgi:hypothetical protein